MTQPIEEYEQPEEVVQWITPSTCALLKSLHGLGDEEQRKKLSDLGLGSRAVLKILDIVDGIQADNTLGLTDYGRRVVEFLNSEH